MPTKFCKFCIPEGKEKDLEDFPRNRAMKDGRDNRCKDCWRIYSAEKRARGKLTPSTKFSKQAPVRSEKKVVEPEVVTAEIKRVMANLDRITISKLSKLPGDRKFFEWQGALATGLARYHEKYGLHATTVYDFTGSFPRLFIGR